MFIGLWLISVIIASSCENCKYCRMAAQKLGVHEFSVDVSTIHIFCE